MPLSPGQTLKERYRIVALLGQGGFGAVYRAWDLNLQEPVAVKESFETDPAAQRQFQLEAKLLFRLVHPNLPRVHDTFAIPGQGIYLVMDYIQGQDLESLLQEAGGQPLPQPKVIDWIGQICDALGYLHAQNPPVIHRDLKPANIRITPDGRAMLVDFGIAKVFDETLKTTTGARALTAGFAPVEQYGQGKTDARSDLYALGATLYVLLTGQRPLESVQRTLKDELAPPERLNPALSGALASVTRRAMQIDPEKRFQSAAEFKRALQGAGQTELVSTIAVQPGASAYSAAALSGGTIAPPAPAQTSAGSGGQSTGGLRWELIGGGLLALLLVGIFGLIALSLVVSNFFGKPPANPQGTTPALAASATLPAAATSAGQPTDEPATASPAASATVLPPEQEDGVQPTSTLFAPADLPADIPIMPGATDLQTFKITNSNATQVTFFTSASDEEIIAYYDDEMPKYGWSNTGEFNNATSRIIYYSKGSMVAMVSISHASGKTIVGVMVMEN